MSKKLLITSMLMASIQASANYGIKPPVTGAPNAGRVSIPRTPETRVRPGIGIGDFEQNQILVSNVLAQAEVKPERESRYREALVKIVQKDPEVKAWLIELNDHFNSDDFKRQSKAQKQKDRFEARLLIEMTIAQFDPAATEEN